MREELHFSIEGEFVTQLLRTWFWDEDRSFDDCHNIVQQICGEDSERITYDILENRKKFVGTNIFQLVDDNKRIRPIIEKINKQKKQLELNKIEKELDYNFIKYVDKWATKKSVHPYALEKSGSPKTYEECVDYFATVRFADGSVAMLDEDLNSPTALGLWLYDYPELIWEITYRDEAEDFWEEIYLRTKDWPNFRDRNERYLADKRRKEIDKKCFEDLINSTQKENKEELEIFTEEWFNEQAKENINYNIYPDNLEKFEGLISPNGDFYSCDFGGHNIKAYHLCLMNKDKWNITKDFKMDNAFDLLLKKGWCATRFLPSTGTYLTAPMKLTKDQINTIYDLMIKFDEHLDMSNYLED